MNGDTTATEGVEGDQRKGVIVALVAAVGALSLATPAGVAGATPARKAGFGSTVKKWKQTRALEVRLGCNEDGLCFGPPVHNVTNGSTALFGEAPSLFGHVVVVADEVVGCSLWFLNFSTWHGVHGIHLEDLIIRSAHRGQGLGLALLVELARECTRRG